MYMEVDSTSFMPEFSRLTFDIFDQFFLSLQSPKAWYKWITILSQLYVQDISLSSSMDRYVCDKPWEKSNCHRLWVWLPSGHNNWCQYSQASILIIFINPCWKLRSYFQWSQNFREGVRRTSNLHQTFPLLSTSSHSSSLSWSKTKPNLW